MSRLYRLLCLALALTPFAIVAYRERQEQKAAEAWAEQVKKSNREISEIRARNRRIAEEMERMRR